MNDLLLILPIELWGYMMQFLDPFSITQLQLSCKLFYQLGIEEFLWKYTCRKYFPRSTYLDFDGSWRSLYKSIVNCNQTISGVREHGISFQGWQNEDNVARISFEISYQPKTAKDYSGCYGISGRGIARWGTFMAVGIAWGNYYAFTHLYSAIPAVFSTLIGKSLEDGKAMNGYWKTVWQGATGSFFSGEPGIPTISPPEEEDEDGSKHFIRGKWTVTMVGQYDTKIEISLDILQKKFNGFHGHAPTCSNEIVLGSIYGNMASFSFLWLGGGDVTIVTAIVEMKNYNELKGRVLFADENTEVFECGTVTLIRATANK